MATISLKKLFWKSQGAPVMQSYTSAFLPYFRILSVVGRAPISAKTELSSSALPFEKVVYFETKNKIGCRITTGIVQLLWLILAISYVNNTVFSNPFPFHIFQLTKYSTRVHFAGMSPFVLYVLASMDIVLTIVTFVEFLLCWKSASRFRRNLGTVAALDLKDVERIRNTFFARLVLLLSFLMVMCVIFGFPNPELTSIVQTITRIVFVISQPLLFMLEDGKFLMLFKMSEHAFHQISLILKDGVSRSNLKWGYQTHPHLMIQLSIATIKIREHCTELGKCITTQMLVTLSGIIFYSTCALFIVVKAILNLIQEGHVDSIFLFPVLIALISLARYCRIIKGAVKITEKEKELAKVLKETELDFPELKADRLHDLLVQSPTEISLSGYVTLNGKLILGLLSQILTQIIIFLQFDN